MSHRSIMGTIMKKLEELELQARLMKGMGASVAQVKAALLPKAKKQAKGSKPSHWEKITGGLCNADFEEVKAKPLTARQIKDMAARPKHVKKAAAKFEKAQHVTGKDSRKLSDSWQDRGAKDVRGFFDRKAARAAKRNPVTVATC
jgi:hypothetical protein